MKGRFALLISLGLIASVVWSRPPAVEDGPYKRYADNAQGWGHKMPIPLLTVAGDPAQRTGNWSVVSRKVRPDDRLPGLKRKDVQRWVGQPLRGIAYGGHWVVPPLFHAVHPLDTETAVVLTYGKPGAPSGLAFLNIPSGKLSRVTLAGEPSGDWLFYQVFPGPVPADTRVWLATVHPDDPEGMQVGVYNGHGKPVFAEPYLKRPPGHHPILLPHNQTLFIHTRDESGEAVAVAFDLQGTPLDLVVPPPTTLNRVPTNAEWYEEWRPRQPDAQPERAIAIGDLETGQAIALSDNRLFLPLDATGRPLPLPSGALGMIPLIAYNSDPDSPIYTNMGETVGHKLVYDRAHTGWILVLADGEGLELQVGGGDAAQVVAEARAGMLPAFKRLWPASGHRLLYDYVAEGPEGERIVYTATAPARYFGERTDGSFSAINLVSGQIDPLWRNGDSRGSLDELKRELSITDGLMKDRVVAEAVDTYLSFQQRRKALADAALERAEAQRQREAERMRRLEAAAAREQEARMPVLRQALEAGNRRAALQILFDCEYPQPAIDRAFFKKFGASDWARLEWARKSGMPAAWLEEQRALLARRDAEAAAREREIDANRHQPVRMDYGTLFHSWRLQQDFREQEQKVRVFHEGNRTRIVTYR